MIRTRSRVNAPFCGLPGRFLDAVDHALVGESAEDDTRHTEGLVDGASSAGEDAAVPDASEGAVSRKLRELVAVLLAQLAGKACVFAESLVQIPSELEFLRQLAAVVVSDVRVFLTN